MREGPSLLRAHTDGATALSLMLTLGEPRTIRREKEGRGMQLKRIFARQEAFDKRKTTC